MEADGLATFGHLLRQARRRAGFTQESLAERAGISVRAISDLERGIIRAPRRDTLELLADALELPNASRSEWIRHRRHLAVRTRASTKPWAAPAVAADPVRVPAPLDELLGREKDVASVLSLLVSARLVTLIGPGGIGKTRLAIAVSLAASPDFPDGVVFTELAPIRDSALVLPSIAATLKIRPVGDQPLVEAVRAFMSNKRLLLVMDNLEQVIEAAPIISDLLESASHLKVLATSRKRLAVRGERCYSVPPLALPDSDTTELSKLQSSPAVRLFLDRAAAIDGEIAPKADNLRAVAEICRRLDGLPLAIELAAARTVVLSVEAIRTRLDHKLSLLTGGPRDAPTRQHTQRATIEWSHDLLAPEQQRLFRQLAVFSGGWLLEAAEAVCDSSANAETNILDTLLVLVESQLVTQRLQPDGDIRFGMLETIHEFALEHLAASGEESAVRCRHAAHFIELAETQEPLLDGLDGLDQIAALDRLEREHDNLRAALDWLVAEGDTERGLRLAGSLRMFWMFHGHLIEGRRQYDEVIALPAAASFPALLAKALTGAGLLACWQEDDERATELANAALTIWQRLPRNQQRGASLSLFTLADIAMDRGDFVAAGAITEEMLPLARRTNDGLGIRCALAMRGVVAGNKGDLEEAQRNFHECLELSRKAGDQLHTASMLCNLAVLEQINGRYDAARPLLEEGLAIQRRLGTKVNLTSTLENLGENARSNQTADGRSRPVS